MDRQASIYVAGGDTLLGAALLRQLEQQGFEDVVGGPPHEPDFDNVAQVEDFFRTVRPAYVFVAAGPTGGIDENRRRPADLMIDNLSVATHLIPAAFRCGVRKLLYIASSCCYPKLAGLRLCQAYRQQYDAPFITAIPANLFGPCDDFHADTGHVIPAMIRRMHKAKRRNDRWLDLWGTGLPRRDFLYVDDAADACIFLMHDYHGATPINIGSGRDWSIAETAYLLAKIIGYRGQLEFDATMPDGAPRKMLDATPLFELGWQPRTEFADALAMTYAWFLEHEVTEDVHVHAAA